MTHVEFVEYDQEFLDRSWTWLTDPEIKRLTDTPTFTREQQAAWFTSLPDKADTYFLRGIVCDGEKIGVVGLKNITAEDGEYWGYIGEREYWGRGIGKRMLAFIEDEARRRGLTSVYLVVVVDNPRAIALYEKRGYLRDDERSSDSSLFMRKGFET